MLADTIRLGFSMLPCCNLPAMSYTFLSSFASLRAAQQIETRFRCLPTARHIPSNHWQIQHPVYSAVRIRAERRRTQPELWWLSQTKHLREPKNSCDIIGMALIVFIGNLFDLGSQYALAFQPAGTIRPGLSISHHVILPALSALFCHLRSYLYTPIH